MSIIVDVANVVPNATNVMDLRWFPSNLHTHLHPSADILHLLETLHHVPS
jgi:hypothetical protein